MRKVLSLLLCVALLCSMVVISVQADGGAALSVANAVAIPGSTVVLDININDNPGVTAVKLRVTDVDGLGATYAGATAITTPNWGFQANDAKGVYVFAGPTAITTVNFGTLAITIPDEAEAGVYHFTLASGTGDDQAVNGATPVDIATAEFTITVSDKVITGVNVAIDAGLAIGIHVSTTDADNTSITAVDVAGEQFMTVEDYKEDEENGGYIYYLKVNPWDMDKEFTVDLTDNFSIDEGTDELNLNAIPETARTISILSYCNAVKGTSDELDQLIADLIEFGRQAQIFQNGATTLAIPEGLAATEAAWENGDGDPCSFGDFCSENFPEDQTGKNNTAKKKFKFVDATIEFGSQFVVTLSVGPNGTATAISNARIKVGGDTFSFEGTGTNTGTYTYSFSPAEYAGVEFDLYASGTTNATNFAWINNYGPAHYAAYLNDNFEDAGDILAILEAFYNYGVSVEAYAATLG